ncbi:YlbE-like family protein [Bacillus luteolus]|uniref:YlbE-like family protein n=1 Tax=Litchfieldia luteola TaxID=682179 RepID=A0ABR9QKB5_9BACI|nr:YlbE-like family protein [Cytobacillus luteolus]MBE4908851.1 YlbE-like family protein [Cytobacillus luteolus]MBP1941709.1 hypothetical protein [Cytobacillus luteolus]
MRKDVVQLIQEDKKILQFIRANPRWYRNLTRNPTDIESLKLSSMYYYKQTIPDKVEKFSNTLGLASMMLHMYQSMKEGD